jgi:AcrR family transcriptional regulator
MSHARTAAGRAALLRAAREELAGRGYAAASIRSIAGRAGISTSLLYHYYPSRQQLLEAVILETIDAYLTSCHAALAQAGDDPITCLSAAVAATIRYRVSRPARPSRLDPQERSLTPGFRQAYRKRAADAASLLRGPIQAGIAADLFRPAYSEEARRAISAMCRAAGDRYDPHGPLTLDQTVARHVELALALLGHGTNLDAGGERPPADPDNSSLLPGVLPAEGWVHA